MNDVRDGIKLYSSPVEGTDTTFRLCDLGYIYDMDEEPKVPHRHEYYTIVVVKRGVGKHFVDFESYSLGENQVFFVSPGQVHQILDEERPQGFRILFTEEFLVKNNFPEDFIPRLALFHEFGGSPPLKLSDESFASLADLFPQMNAYYNSNKTYEIEAIGAMLKLFLIKSYELSLSEKGDQKIRQQSVLLHKEFKELLNKQFKNIHSSKEFAAQLNITPDHLNRTVKSLTGKTAKEIIQTKIMVEAKRLLYFSNLSNKEIAFELGFHEPSHFSAFFKKETGKAPSMYRSR